LCGSTSGKSVNLTGHCSNPWRVPRYRSRRHTAHFSASRFAKEDKVLIGSDGFGDELGTEKLEAITLDKLFREFFGSVCKIAQVMPLYICCMRSPEMLWCPMTCDSDRSTLLRREEMITDMGVQIGSNSGRLIRFITVYIVFTFCQFSCRKLGIDLLQADFQGIVSGILLVHPLQWQAAAALHLPLEIAREQLRGTLAALTGEEDMPVEDSLRALVWRLVGDDRPGWWRGGFQRGNGRIKGSALGRVRRRIT
jgi:hypothetical protein